MAPEPVASAEMLDPDDLTTEPQAAGPEAAEPVHEAPSGPEPTVAETITRVQLLRPTALTRVSVGGRVRGIGWISCQAPPASIAVELGPVAGDLISLGEAQLGLSSTDIALLIGQAPDGPGAGFVFTVTVPRLPPGPLTLRLRIDTVSGHYVHDLALILLATPGAALPDAAPEPAGPDAAGDGPDPEAIKFYLDAPVCKNGVAIETVRGFLSIVGWAIGRAGIDHIEVFVDGISQGRAHHGVRREDLQAAFPDYEASRAGFAMMLPPQTMKPGTREVRIDICDKVGRAKEISFSVNAEAPATGPGPWSLRQKLPQSEIDLMQAVLSRSAQPPHWTILLLLDDDAETTIAGLSATIESLRWQASEAWSLLVLAAAAEHVPIIEAALDASLNATADASRRRVRVVPPPEAGQKPRSLSELTDGYLVMLTPGDRLGEDALLELGIELTLQTGVDFIYSDERRVDPADGVEKAFFKPDFSPDLLLSTNYIGRLWAAAPALLARTGLTEADLRLHGDYDAVLRLTERAERVGHVAKVLCARGVPPRRLSQRRDRAALLRALRRRRIRGTVLPGPVRGTWRLQRSVAEPPAIVASSAYPASCLVSIIIPTIAARGFVRAAIESIRAKTTWPAYEIICIDNIPRNGSAEQRGWKDWIAANADRTVEIGEKFNWSRFNNRGARAAKGGYLLFLNDDVEVQDGDWLHGLIEHAQRPEIGVVGPQLLYPDGRVQHAGVFLARRAARHAFRFYASDEPGPFGLALTQRDVISVTGAAMLLRREVFDALGGFDEAHAVVNNDLDFCLRVRAAGLGVVYTPAVSLIHHEAVSRAALADVFDSKRFAAAWGDLFLKGDPFFSRHFSPDADDYLPDAEPVRRFTAGNPLVSRAKIRRILAIKVDHIGDFITAFPAFRRIKAHFPDAELTVLAARASLQLAALEPAIDRLIEFNFFHARSEKGRRAQIAEELAALRTQLAPLQFDLAIDLRRQSDTRPILQATAARWLAGFEMSYQHPWLDVAVEFEGDIALCLKRGHISSALVGLVDQVSAQCEADRRVVRDPIQRSAARQILSRFMTIEPGVTELVSRSLVCVHTGAGALNKQWPAASFAGLIDLLAGEADAAILIIGGPDESAFAKSVIKLVRRQKNVTNLVGHVGLRELPAVLRAADLYVGNDSGPKHMAAALGVPTIGIHSGSVDAGEWGAVGPQALTIRREMSCSPCYLARAGDCHRGLACLDGIRVGDVFDACRRMLTLSGPLQAGDSCNSNVAIEQAAD